jgi:hypothetical protein
MEELKPCPFCGGTKLRTMAWNICVDAHIECEKCGASSGYYNAEEKKGKTRPKDYEKRCVKLAVNAWNKRV